MLPERKEFHKLPLFDGLVDQINRGEKKIFLSGLYGSAKALLIALLFKNTNQPIVAVYPTEKEAISAFRDICFFLDEEAKEVFLYPHWDIISTDLFAFQRETELSRIEILYRLLTGRRSLVIVALKALTQKVMPRSTLQNYAETISIGDTKERDAFIEKLIQGGYHRVSLVEEKGEFSSRGNVIDVFPPASSNPIRIEFIGDDIESIREFEPPQQKSKNEIAEFLLLPARELVMDAKRKELAVHNTKIRANELELPGTAKNRLVEMIENNLISSINPLFLPLFYESLHSFFDYIPDKTTLIFDNYSIISQTRERVENEMDRFLLKAHNENKFHLEKKSSFLTEEDFFEYCGRFQQISIDELSFGMEGYGESSSSAAFRFGMRADTDTNLKAAIKGSGEEKGLFRPVAESIKKWISEGYLVTFLCSGKEELERTEHLMGKYSLNAKRLSNPFLNDIKYHSGGRLTLREGRISSSFQFPDMKLIIITDEEVFGKKAFSRRGKPTREGYFLKSFGDLKEGDYVVHTDHGIATYRGLQKLSIGEIDNDFLLLEYAGRDKLYIPVDRLDQIQRYIGPDDYIPKIDRLGGSSWDSVKEKVKKSIREVAEELVSIYAKRETMEGHAFSPPDSLYEEFCSTFEYEETPDQAKSIEDVHADMISPKPMDRLICGDAGFGKTEVALRASFIAVMDGKQVAFLVPTTILAEQHFQTFSSRLKNFPVRVDVLNRLRTKAEQKKTAEDTKNGKVDILIGTHRILQDDIEFKDLGLVIIDEEQRFGVAHKEKLKKIRNLVDVLTLTATPIPRTLHLSLVGIRDLSIIHTPPENRLPVKTHVVEFDENIIKEAIEKELRREGQVYFLHDRIQSIYRMASFIAKLVPEAKIEVVHGRMKGKDIEQAMTSFIRRECNVLVCTSIVASGLDIPSANTIIINRADRFGLSTLYQLRGRVGRSKEEAFAYLIVPKGAMLSRDATKRLSVIMDFTEPGSGFSIASSDLEIRGTGNIIGTSQSGHISAVGYELYTELMEKTIRELKGEAMPEKELKPEINLNLPAFIPEDYMADVNRRLVTYKRLSMAQTDEVLSEIKDELKDCFGYIPIEVENIFEVIRIKNLLKVVKGTKMGYDGKQMFIHFRQDSTVNPASIIRMTKKGYKEVRLTPDYKLYISIPGLSGREITESAKSLLKELMN